MLWTIFQIMLINDRRWFISDINIATGFFMRIKRMMRIREANMGKELLAIISTLAQPFGAAFSDEGGRV